MNFFYRFKPYPELKTVIVNLKNGTSFRGVIWNRNKGGFMVLKNCILLSAEKNVTIDGDCLIPRNEVEFIQVL